METFGDRKRIMFKVQKTISYTTIPKAFLEDNTLSVVAKGLLASIYHSGDITFLKESKDVLRPYVQELVSKGYCKVEDKNIIVLLRPKTRNIKTTDDFNMDKPKRQTLYEYMLELTQDFSKEEKDLFIQYFNIRVSAPKGTRFEQRPLHKFELRSLVESLKLMKGNKVEIIKQSIDKQYLKFVDLPKTMSKDKLVTNVATKEEVDSYKNQLESEGLLSEF